MDLIPVLGDKDYNIDIRDISIFHGRGSVFPAPGPARWNYYPEALDFTGALVFPSEFIRTIGYIIRMRISFVLETEAAGFRPFWMHVDNKDLLVDMISVCCRGVAPNQVMMYFGYKEIYICKPDMVIDISRDTDEYMIVSSEISYLTKSKFQPRNVSV